MSAPTTQSNSALCELLTWKNPAATGKVFGSIVAVLLLVKINIVNYVFYVAYLALLVSAAAEYVGKLVVGQGFVTKYRGTPKEYARLFNNSVLPALSNAATIVESHVQSIVYAQDIEATLKAAGASYILYKLTSFFSLYTLLFATVVLAFSFPPLYQANKKEIDAAVAQYSALAKEKTSEYTAVAQKKIAPHLETLAKKTGPVGEFIQSKFPTRTAGSTVGTAPVAESAPSVPSTSPLASLESAVASGATKLSEAPQVTKASTFEVPELS